MLNTTLLILLLLLTILVFYKLRKVHLLQYKIFNSISQHADNSLRQIESLDSLYRDLKFSKSLPVTRGWAASPDLLLKLKEIVLQKEPKVVVECSSGITTLVIAKCLEVLGGGHVYSLEHDSKFAEVTRQNLLKHGLGQYATVVDAPLTTYELTEEKFNWYNITNLTVESIEMLVIDGPPMSTNKHARYPAFPVLRDKLANDSMIILDDADRKDESEIINKWLDEDSALEVGEKAYCEKGCVVLHFSPV